MYINIIEYVSKHDKNIFESWVKQIKEIPSTFVLSEDSLNKVKDKLKKDKNMLLSTMLTLESIVGCRYFMKASVLKQSIFFPAYPTLHHDIMKDPYYASIQNTIIILLDTLMNPDKYDEEYKTRIQDKSRACILEVRKIIETI